MLRDTYIFPISQPRIKIALFGTIYSSELIVPSIGTLLRPRYGKDQTEPLHTCRGIRIYNISGLFLSLLKSISLNPTIMQQSTIYREYVIIIYFIVTRKKAIISLMIAPSCNLINHPILDSNIFFLLSILPSQGDIIRIV
jgi:hypothetical protein